jgi:hypothetical protein
LQYKHLKQYIVQNRDNSMILAMKIGRNKKKKKRVEIEPRLVAGDGLQVKRRQQQSSLRGTWI